MNCSFILKGSQVDGVYSDDPLKNPKAQKYQKLTYMEVINNNLSIMDTAAVVLAKDNKIPILVFNISKKQEFAKVTKKKGDFTEIN